MKTIIIVAAIIFLAVSSSLGLVDLPAKWEKMSLTCRILLIFFALVIVLYYLIQDGIISVEDAIAYTPVALLIILILILFFCVCKFWRQHRKLEAKYDALMCLHNEGKVNTINYILGFDALSKQPGQQRKTNDLNVISATFTFLIHNESCKENACRNCSNRDTAGVKEPTKCAFDVTYKHNFLLSARQEKSDRRVDFLILHAYGGMNDISCVCDQVDYSNDIDPEPVPAISRDIAVNRQLSRCQCTPYWDKIAKEKTPMLSFGYKINGEHSLINNIESFVIYPKNFAKRIDQPLFFEVTYSVKPQRTASVSLWKLSIERKEKKLEMVEVQSGGIPKIENGSYTYICRTPDKEPVDMESIYFVIIKYKKEKGSSQETHDHHPPYPPN